jgi:hypothetical protein
MTDSKRTLLKNILLITAGLGLAFIFPDNSNWFIKAIQIGGVILAGWNVISFFINLQFVIDDVFPVKTFDKKTKKGTDQSIIIFTNLLFFSGALAFIFQCNKIDNTINGLQLYWIAVAAGIVCSALLMLLFKKMSPSFYTDSTRRYTVITGMLLASLMFYPAVASFINIQFAKNQFVTHTYMVTDKSENSRGRQCFMDCQTENGDERFAISKKIYNNIIIGNYIDMHLQKGCLGYYFVKEFLPGIANK